MAMDPATFAKVDGNGFWYLLKEGADTSGATPADADILERHRLGKVEYFDGAGNVVGTVEPSAGACVVTTTTGSVVFTATGFDIDDPTGIAVVISTVDGTVTLMNLDTGATTTYTFDGANGLVPGKGGWFSGVHRDGEGDATSWLSAGYGGSSTRQVPQAFDASKSGSDAAYSIGGPNVLPSIVGAFLFDQTWDDDGELTRTKIRPFNEVELLVANFPISAPASTSQAPGNLDAVAGNAEVILTWDTPGDDGGAPIYGYVAYAAVGSDLVDQRYVDGQVNGYTFDGLTNGTTYSFYVHALTTEGLSSLSVQSPFATPAP